MRVNVWWNMSNVSENCVKNMAKRSKKLLPFSVRRKQCTPDTNAGQTNSLFIISLPYVTFTAYPPTTFWAEKNSFLMNWRRRRHDLASPWFFASLHELNCNRNAPIGAIHANRQLHPLAKRAKGARLHEDQRAEWNGGFWKPLSPHSLCSCADNLPLLTPQSLLTVVGTPTLQARKGRKFYLYKPFFFCYNSIVISVFRRKYET